jgi:hypothetical protein
MIHTCVSEEGLDWDRLIYGLVAAEGNHGQNCQQYHDDDEYDVPCCVVVCWFSWFRVHYDHRHDAHRGRCRGRLSDDEII